MYFSRVRIHTGAIPHGTLLRVLRGDAYASHKLIWKLFSNNPLDKRAFLFRQEVEKEQLPLSIERRGLPIYYVVSEKRPVNLDGLMQVETKTYNPQLSPSMRLSFELRVNPVIARAAAGNKISSKHDVMMDAKRRAKQENVTDRALVRAAMDAAAVNWLYERASALGFRLIDRSLVEVSGYRQHFVRRRDSRGITFSSVDLSGALEVIDPEKVRTLLFTGMGRSRSFGCGMMMVRPLQ